MDPIHSVVKPINEKNENILITLVSYIYRSIGYIYLLIDLMELDC